MTNIYTWHNPDNTTIGEFAGTADADDDTIDNTHAFVTTVNAAGLCGVNDWRMPTREELHSLVDYSITSLGPTIDKTYFPNTVSSPFSPFWSSSSDTRRTVEAWNINFGIGGKGNVFIADKGFSHSVRLVRNGQ